MVQALTTEQKPGLLSWPSSFAETGAGARAGAGPGPSVLTSPIVQISEKGSREILERRVIQLHVAKFYEHSTSKYMFLNL